jgi:2-polyprenyl-3-methyl-5-hydroxy-6-metoxy-1,4-benzoquinol methylase
MFSTKTINFIKKNSLLEIIKKVIKHPLNILERKKFKKNILATNDTEYKFTWIYKNNYWGYESVSGTGSTLSYTENIRQQLPKLISQFNIKSVLDAPCGDFGWMKILLPKLNVNYIGADIVKELIESHKTNYQNEVVKFITLDLITDKFPKSDLMICRDCLFHLSYDDIWSVLLNFVNSDTTYLLTTTHKNKYNFKNTNIQTGDYRMIDLFSHPFNFPTNPLARIDDGMELKQEKEMCLFTKEQIKLLVDNYFKPSTHLQL